MLVGTLDVRLVDVGAEVFSPAAGDTYEIVSAAGGVVGRFENEVLPALGDDLIWRVLYGANDVSLAVTFGGDYNGDFVVDAGDYVAWRKHGGPQEGYENWRANFGRTAGGGAGSADFDQHRGAGASPGQLAVPEPSLSLLLAAWIVVNFVPPRRRVFTSRSA
jgi:hypothetical protein